MLDVHYFVALRGPVKLAKNGREVRIQISSPSVVSDVCF